jgi:hypothetical protein
MTLTEQERDRYADIVLGYLDGDYTLDPLDAGCVAHDVIAAYQQDQQARLAVVEAAQLYRRAVVQAEAMHIAHGRRGASEQAATIVNHARLTAKHRYDRLMQLVEALDNATEQESSHE